MAEGQVARQSHVANKDAPRVQGFACAQEFLSRAFLRLRGRTDCDVARISVLLQTDTDRVRASNLFREGAAPRLGLSLRHLVGRHLGLRAAFICLRLLMLFPF